MKKSMMALLALVICAAFSVQADWLEDRFGKELYDAKGKKVKVEELKGKTIGVYFSAHWCPPCRAFTPKLVDFRDKVAKKGFEIVFVSADRSSDKMYEYMKETNMKWPAVEFRGDKANALFQDLGVRGIPYLVIFDKNGKEITRDGRADVMKYGKKALKVWTK